MRKLIKFSCIGGSACTSRKEKERETRCAPLNMAALKDVASLYQNLKQEWTKTPCNLKKCGELLSQLKASQF